MAMRGNRSHCKEATMHTEARARHRDRVRGTRSGVRFGVGASFILASAASRVLHTPRSISSSGVFRNHSRRFPRVWWLRVQVILECGSRVSSLASRHSNVLRPQDGLRLGVGVTIGLGVRGGDGVDVRIRVRAIYGYADRCC